MFKCSRVQEILLITLMKSYKIKPERLFSLLVALVIGLGMAIASGFFGVKQSIQAFKLIVKKDRNGSEWIPFSDVISTAYGSKLVWIGIPGRRRRVQLFDGVSSQGKSVLIIAPINSLLDGGCVKFLPDNVYNIPEELYAKYPIYLYSQDPARDLVFKSLGLYLVALLSVGIVFVFVKDSCVENKVP